MGAIGIWTNCPLFSPHPLNPDSDPHCGTPKMLPFIYFQTPLVGKRYHLVAKHLMWCHHLFVGQIAECLLMTGTLLDVGNVEVKSSI